MEEQKRKILVEIFGDPQLSGDEIIFYCPKCKHQKKKLSCNIKKNVFKCWVCDFTGSNLGRLIKRYGTSKQIQEWNQYSDKIDLSASSFADFLFESQSKNEETISLPKEFITLTGKYNPNSSQPLKYLFGRRISKQDILKWKIGYCPEGEYYGRIIIPSFNLDGKVNYYVGRSFKDEHKKYKNPPIQKNQIIFNHLYVDWSDDLVLTEGVFDAIVAGNSVPLLGSTLPETSLLFQEIVKHDTPIYVALDPDAEKKAKNLIRDLLKYEIELYKIDVTGRQDVGSTTKDEFQQRKKSAMRMTNQSLFKYQLQGIL